MVKMWGNKQNRGRFGKYTLMFGMILIISVSNQLTFIPNLNSSTGTRNNFSNTRIFNKNYGEEFIDLPNSPQSALSELIFENNPLFIIINEYGFVDNTYLNLWFEGFYHNYFQMSYVSIDDGPVYALNEFSLIETLTNITYYDYGNLNAPVLAQVILQHPDEDVQLKIHFKLYPDKEYFVMTFYISSSTLDNFQAELFVFADLDIDETYSDDFASYDDTYKYIYEFDGSSDNYVGWVSPVDPIKWDLGNPTTVENNLLDDKLKQTNAVILQDYGIVTKYLNDTMNVGETWGVPIIFGFGVGETNFRQNTFNVMNQFKNDFVLLDFQTNLTFNPSLNATILNGGIETDTRNVKVLRNGTEIASQIISLKPGNQSSLLFENLPLIPGGDNEIRVEIESAANDYAMNNNITETFHFDRQTGFLITDLSSNGIENANLTIFNQESQNLYENSLTTSEGLVYFSNIENGNYTAEVCFPWILTEDLQCVASINFTVPTSQELYEIQTNTTTLELSIQDVANNSVQNVSISIFSNETSDLLWEGSTNQMGNVSFMYRNQSVDVNITYWKYGTTLDLGQIQDIDMSSQTFLTQNVDLTNLTLHFTTQTSQENMTGAKIEFYHRLSGDSFGDLIGYEIADSNGNVSIRWSSLIDYAIRVFFFSEAQPIGVTLAEAVNFTGSPFNEYIFASYNVTLGGGGLLEDFTTELVLFNRLPIKYIWNELIDLKFMFNVTGPAGYEGPIWADETSVIIRNSLNEIVYDGNATNIPSQMGNHSFIVNTSTGFFTSANPETYTFEINAIVYGYSNPNPIIKNFNIYNISTEFSLEQTSTSLIWKDNFTITAYYNDTTNSVPISGANVTLTWGSYLQQISLEEIEPGIYSTSINSSIGIPGQDIIIIEAEKPHYDQKSKSFSITLYNIPTSVNGTILFDSEHSIYVTTENLTLNYEFFDSYRNRTIPDQNLTYQLVHSTTKEIVAGNLTYINGGYLFDAHTSFLPIGVYRGLIEFQSFGYISSYASIQLTILSIPTHLNDTQLKSTPLQLYALTPKDLHFNFTNSLTNSSIGGVSTSYNVVDIGSSMIIKSGFLEEELSGLYLFSPQTELLAIGNYRVEMQFSKTNFTSISSEFLLYIQLIPTQVNDSSLLDVPYSLYYGDSLSFNFQFKDTYRNLIVGDIFPNYTIYLIENSEIVAEFPGLLNPVGLDEYQFSPSLLSFALGTYSVEILFDKENYTSYSVQFSFILQPIPTNVNDSSLLEIPYSLYYGDGLVFNFQYNDTYRNQAIDGILPNYTISHIHDSDIITQYPGFLSPFGINQYQFAPSFLNLELGTYNVEILFQKENYTSFIVQFSFILQAIPTSVNDSSLSSVPYELFYGQSLDFTFQYLDTYRNTSIELLNLSYSIFRIENSQIVATFEKFLEIAGLNSYRFSPNFLALPLGSYTVEIPFSKENYSSYIVDFAFTIQAIPTTVNDSSLSSVPYVLFYGQSLDFTFNYLDTYRNTSIELANLNYSIFRIEDSQIVTTFEYNLEIVGVNNYRFSPSFLAFPLGSYTVVIPFSKENYSSYIVEFSFTIQAIPTTLNSSSISTLPYEIFIGESFKFNFLFQNQLSSTPISSAGATFNITKVNSEWNLHDVLDEINPGIYLFDPKVSHWASGTYQISISFAMVNHTSKSVSFSIRINPIPFDFDIREAINNLDLDIDDNQINILIRQSVSLNFNLRNVWGDPVNDCNVSYILTKDDESWTGQFFYQSNGNYELNLSIFSDNGLYNLRVILERENYSTEEIQLYIQVDYPTFLGLATPYWLIIGIASAVLISGVVAYVSIKNARIPKYIKDLNYLEKLMKNPKAELPDRYLTRGDQLYSKFALRWEVLDLDTPFKTTGDIIENFGKKYQEATGKLIIAEDARQYLNDVSIYSKTDIKARLLKEGVTSPEMISDLLELISLYLKDLLDKGDKNQPNLEETEEADFDWDFAPEEENRSEGSSSYGNKKDDENTKGGDV